jgi:chromosome segregation ATPase
MVRQHHFSEWALYEIENGRSPTSVEVEALIEEIHYLRNVVEQLEPNLECLEKREKSLNDKLEELNRETLGCETESLTREMAERLARENTDLNEKVSCLYDKIDRLKYGTEIVSLEDKISNLKREMFNLENINDVLKERAFNLEDINDDLEEEVFNLEDINNDLRMSNSI